MSSDVGAVQALRDVVAAWVTARDERREFAYWLAGNHWTLYHFEPNGLLIWRAFLALREHGGPVDEQILGKLEDYALAVLDAAETDGDMLRALELHPRGKVPAGAHLRRMQQTRLIVSAVARQHERGVSLSEAWRRVAAQRGMTVGQVKQQWIRWKAKAERKRDTPKPARSVFEWER